MRSPFLKLVFLILQKSDCAWAFVQHNKIIRHRYFKLFILAAKKFFDKVEIQYYPESLFAIGKYLTDNILLSKYSSKELSTKKPWRNFWYI